MFGRRKVDHERIDVDVDAIRDENAAKQRQAEEMAADRAERIAQDQFDTEVAALRERQSL